ncbi:hypothetical protein FJY94_04265 [Candidatus Kaiserbacteria bacterium]|nr:hypothetical protein [Candidatus Kaiserbacteria bacterium]
MHVTRLLRYGLLFTALSWSWLYVFALVFPAWFPLIIFFYAGILVILYLLTAMFFSQVEPTFWRGIALGATVMLTFRILESVSLVTAIARISADFGVWYLLSTGIKEFASDFGLLPIALCAIIVGTLAVLPQTALIARRMAPQAQPY